MVFDDPPSGGEGFTARYRGDVAEGEPDMLSVELLDGELDRVGVLGLPGSRARRGEDRRQLELFAEGAAALGDFEPVAVVDLDAFTGAFLGDGSVVDVVTGELSATTRSPAFIAEQLHVVAFGGSSGDDDRAIQRNVIRIGRVTLGAGIDLIEIERLERALERAPRSPSASSPPRELEAARARSSRPAAGGAFAAKEAAMKALGLGGLRLHEVEVEGGKDAAPRSPLGLGRAGCRRARGGARGLAHALTRAGRGGRHRPPARR